MLMLDALGAPVTDAQGNSAARISGKDALVVAVTVDVICHTVGYFSTSYNDSSCTEPASATRPMSLRIMSVIMTFSARFLADDCNSLATARSTDDVMARAAVPFMGRQVSSVPASEKKSSGDADTIV